jgi:hypothetical protein
VVAAARREPPALSRPDVVSYPRRTVILDEVVLTALLQHLLVRILVDIFVDVALLFELHAAKRAALASWIAHGS